MSLQSEKKSPQELKDIARRKMAGNESCSTQRSTITKEEMQEMLSGQIGLLDSQTESMLQRIDQAARQAEDRIEKAMKEAEQTAGRMSENFSNSLYMEEERMKEYTFRTMFLSLIPSAAVIILGLVLVLLLRG